MGCSIADLGSRLGERQTARRTIDEACAESLIDPGDGLGNPRRGQLQFGAGARKGVHLNDLSGHRQAVEIRGSLVTLISGAMRNYTTSTMAPLRLAIADCGAEGGL